MTGEVVGPDIVAEHAVELLQRMDGADVKPVQPGLLECAPLALDLLYEYSDKRSYTKDFFIRIFLRKRLDWPLLF